MPSCDRLKQFVRQERILVNNAKRAPAIADYFAATKIPRFGGELWWIESPHALMETKHTKDCHLLVWDMHWQAYSDALIEALMVDVRVVGWEQRLKSNLAAIELVFATEQGLCAYYPDTSFSSHFIDIMCGRDIENIHVSRIDFETTTDKKTLLMLQILVQSLTLFHEATHILYEYDSSFRSSAIEVIQGMAAQLKENLVTKQEDVHLEKRIFQIIDGIANPRISGINNSEFVCDFMAIAWFYDWIADHSYTRQKDASYFILGPLAIQMYFFSLRFFEQIRSDVVKLSRGKLQFIRHPSRSGS